jgi:hypothetical protein
MNPVWGEIAVRYSVLALSTDKNVFYVEAQLPYADNDKQKKAMDIAKESKSCSVNTKEEFK